MPSYEVTVQGRGIALPLDTAVAVGFLTVVQLRARDPLEAETRAVDRRRSIALAQMTPLAGVGGMSFVSLQKGAEIGRAHV